MPNGIYIISAMPLPDFTDLDALTVRINTYFEFIEGEYHLENKPAKGAKENDIVVQKVWDRDPEPPTFAGFAFFLGFSSLEEFDEYIEQGAFAETLKRGRLRIEASYEKKLHTQATTGTIFALKSMGWKERTENKQTVIPQTEAIKIEIIESGPPPAESEKEVIL